MATGTRTWIGGKTAATTDFNQADNYAEAAKPITNDNLYYPSQNAYGVDTNIAQSAIDLNSLVVEQGSPVQIGTLSAAGVPTYLEIGLNGVDDPGGDTLKMLDYGGTGACYFDIDDSSEIKIRSAASGGTYTYGLVLVGTGNTVCDIVASTIQPGTNKIGLAPFGGGSFDCDAVNIAAHQVYLGKGCNASGSAVPLTISGGTVFSECALAASTVSGGGLTIRRGAVAGLTISNATVSYEGNGVLTSLVLDTRGVLDASVGTGSIGSIPSTFQMHSGSSFIDPLGRFGNVKIEFVGCDAGEVTIDTPNSKFITFSDS